MITDKFTCTCQASTNRSFGQQYSHSSILKSDHDDVDLILVKAEADGVR